MELHLEPKPVLAVCPNPAWQKTLCFEHYRAGEVNRASRVQENGGGKGVNLARVLQSLGFPADKPELRQAVSDKLKKLMIEHQHVIGPRITRPPAP